MLLPGEAVTAMVFGKLPAHGDFVARGIAPDVQAEIDGWLAQEMARARTVHGAAFERLFDHAPVWRFAWAQGASGWSGAMSPSTDRIGRRYPVIAGVVAGGNQAALACEDQLYAALVEQWSVDTLHDAIKAIPTDSANAPVSSRWWTEGNDDFAPASLDGDRPADLIATMLTPRGEREWA